MAIIRLNGEYISSNNAQIIVFSDIYLGLKSLNITSKTNPVFVKGIGSSSPVGRTQGEEETSGDMEMGAQEYAYLRKGLSAKHALGSYALVPFDIQVTYNNGVDPVIRVVARQCRILEQNDSIAAGSADPLMVKSPLSIMYVERDGKRMINSASAFAGLR